jgi:hypothetical protein
MLSAAVRKHPPSDCNGVAALIQPSRLSLYALVTGAKTATLFTIQAKTAQTPVSTP